MMTSFFVVSVLVSNFGGLGLKAKVETETGLGLGKICGLGLSFKRVGLDYSPVNQRIHFCAWFILSIDLANLRNVF